jgi:hypothetical protein
VGSSIHGFEASWFKKLANEISFAVQIMDMKDNILRRFAFDEAEAGKFLEQSAKRIKYNEVRTPRK